MKSQITGQEQICFNQTDITETHELPDNNWVNDNPVEHRASSKNNDVCHSIDDLSEDQQRKIDNCMDTTGWSYDEARYMLFGIMPDQTNSRNITETRKTTNEDFSDFHGASYDLEDSTKLIEALDLYENAEKIGGLITKSVKEGMSDSGISHLEKAEYRRRNNGDRMLDELFCVDALIRAGFKREEIEAEAKKMRNEFQEKYVGPGKSEQRRKLAKLISARVNLVQQKKE